VPEGQFDDLRGAVTSSLVLRDADKGRAYAEQRLAARQPVLT